VSVTQEYSDLIDCLRDHRLGRAKRLLDIALALSGLAILSPLLVAAAAGIKLTSPGPILYRSRRIGRDRRRWIQDTRSACQGPERRQKMYRGREFTLYKFRTMRMGSDPGALITAHNDSRVFPFGAFLRATKIDELPQLINVVKGDMALVGPRPEAPEIVRTAYGADDMVTLQVRPGVTSPGSLYYYTHSEAKLTGSDVTQTYVLRVLPIKLALDRAYLQRATLAYDVRIILRTAFVIAARCAGWKRFPDPPELRAASPHSLP
jgi:lipopolysaccharide/colanic/teichoic acid biosynthesis glycosyltransferase